MRILAILAAGAGLASCTGVPQQQMRTAQEQAHYLSLIDGKVAGPEMSCLSTYPSNDMSVIDESTVVYRRNGRQVYVGHLQGQCSNLGTPGYAMLTKQYGSSQLCHGDIVHVIDTRSGMLVGGCSIGGFTPYSSPPR